jgi:hypothetical protein
MTKVFVCFLAVLCLAGGICMAQSVQGVVTGTVTDTSGAVVPKASITLTNLGTQVAQELQAGVDGAYRFPLVPPGTYKLTVEASGFTTKEVKGIVVDASTTVPVNVTLSVATAQAVVEVAEQEVLVQTATADLATTINERMIESIPLLTRNVYDLAFAAASVTQGMNMNPSAGGARESGTGYLLNGAENNDNFSEGGINVTPPLESVHEFTLLTNNMNAQYGRAAGAVVSAAQKSGTNTFHGVVYEFNRNRSFNASDFFANRAASPKPKYIRNQYGGEIDGPIVKDKTFFSFAFDRLDLRTGGDLVSQVPTSSELAAMTANDGPLAQQILQQYPPLTSDVPCPAEAVNAPHAIGHIGCVHLFNPTPTIQNSYFGRIDQNFGAHDRLSFTANITRYNFTDKWGAFLGAYATSTKNIPAVDLEHYHHLALVETHIFGANLLSELTVAHNRHYSVNQEGNGKATYPEIIIDGEHYDYMGFGYGAGEGGLVEGFVQDRWQFQDNLAWTKGKHSFKFGGGMMYGILYRNWDLGSPGQYEFGNDIGTATPASVGALNPDGTLGNANWLNTTADPYGDSNFQHDFPYYSELSIDPHTGARGNAYRHYMMKDANLFVNDDFKLSRRLTLNLGLRWERYGAPTESHNIIAQFTNLTGIDPASVKAARVGPVKSMWATQNHDFAPRVGFAYDVLGNGRLSVRGGFGISYDRIFDNVWSNGAWNPPFYALLDHDATNGDTVFYTVPPSVGNYAPDSIPAPGQRVSVRTMDVHMKDSSTQNYFLGVEKQFFRDVLLRVNYQGSMGRHLPQLMNLNRYDGECYNLNLTCVRPNALYTGFNYRANNVTSNYNALVTEVQKRFSHGLQFQFSFAWSKLMDKGSDLFTGSTLTGQYSQPYYYISNSHPSLEYGPGAFDHQQNFKVLFTYELPFFKDQHGFIGHVLGGWQLAGFYQGYSGHPIEVYNGRSKYKGNAVDANGFHENIGGDYNLDRVNTDHPDFIGPSAGSVYSNFSPADGIFKDNNPIGCGFPGAQSTNIDACNSAFGVTTPNTLFINPAGTGLRYGTLGRNLFRGPWFNGIDGSLMKNFKLRERITMQFRFEALNLDNHPNFDGIVTDLNSSNFGKAQILVGESPARRLQLGLRMTF